MLVICSWCQREGRRAFLGMSGSRTDLRVSHGICERHLVRLRAGGLKTVAKRSSHQKSLKHSFRNCPASDPSVLSQ